jgi:hypothetical protein
MEFSGIVTAVGQDDQMGILIFIAAEDHLDRGLYVEISCQLSDFPDISRYLISGDHNLCS